MPSTPPDLTSRDLDFITNALLQASRGRKVLMVMPSQLAATRRQHDLQDILKNIQVVHRDQRIRGLRAHIVDVDPYLEETMTPAEKDRLHAQLQAVKIQEGA